MLGVYTGQLERLPTTLGEDHKRLVDIRVLKNKLRELPESIVKIEGLLKLIVGNNRLRVRKTRDSSIEWYVDIG